MKRRRDGPEGRASGQDRLRQALGDPSSAREALNTKGGCGLRAVLSWGGGGGVQRQGLPVTPRNRGTLGASPLPGQFPARPGGVWHLRPVRHPDTGGQHVGTQRPTTLLRFP